MAAACSLYLQDALAKHLFGIATFTPPANIYLAVFRTMPTEGGGGIEATAYTRPAIKSSMVFAGAGTGRVSNNVIVTATGLPDDTWVGVAAYDAASAGNMLTFGPLGTPKTTTDGTLPFPVGNLIIGFN